VVCEAVKQLTRRATWPLAHGCVGPRQTALVGRDDGRGRYGLTHDTDARRVT
jgi:hypothetical protein